MLVVLVWVGMLVVALDALQPKGKKTMRIWTKTENGTWYGRGNGHKVVIYPHVGIDEVTVRVYDRFEFLVEKVVKADITRAKRYAEKKYLRASK